MSEADKMFKKLEYVKKEKKTTYDITNLEKYGKQ